jgi:hypothetical protein
MDTYMKVKDQHQSYFLMQFNNVEVYQILLYIQDDKIQSYIL